MHHRIIDADVKKNCDHQYPLFINR